MAEGDEKTLNMAVYLLVHEGPFRDQPKQVKDSFQQAVNLLGRAVGVGIIVGKQGYSLYKLVKELTKFVKNPLSWLKDYVGDKAYALLKQYGKVYAKRLVATGFGAHRIGCHSLLNKDSGPELFHEDGMECAKAVHWYVVSAMTRHAWPVEMAVARRSDREAARNVVSGYRWIDWLELLEYFLAYPFGAVEIHAERILYGTVVHRTKRDPHSVMSPDSLRSLARDYRPGFVRVPTGPPALTWEVIADANFPTAGMSTQQRAAQVNKILRQTAQGVVVSDGVNLAFRPDVSVNIPFQKVAVPDASAAEVKERWWYAVIMEKHRVIEAWLQDGRPAGNAPRTAHRWMPIDRSQHATFVKDAFQIRQSMEKAYNA
jgi:hypothetical protein